MSVTSLAAAASGPFLLNETEMMSHDDHNLYNHNDHDHHDHDHDSHGHSYDFIAENNNNDHEESLLSSSNNNIATDDEKPWLPVIIATLIINLTSLCGIMITVFTIMIPRARKKYWERRKQKRMKKTGAAAAISDEVYDDDNNCNDDASALLYYNKLQKEANQKNKRKNNKGWLVDLILPSFAAGALLATCVFLLIPEAINMLGTPGGHGDAYQDADTTSRALLYEDEFGMEHTFRALQEHDSHDHGGDHDSHEGHDSHDSHEGHDHGDGEEATWKFGASLLGGFLLPIVLGVLFPSPHHEDEPCLNCTVAETVAPEREPELQMMTPRTDDTETIEALNNDNANKEEKDVLLFNKNIRDKNVEIVHHASFGMNNSDDNHSIISSESGNKDEERNNNNDQDELERNETSSTSSSTVQKRVIDYRLIFSIIIGDFFHNFTDGIFIGNAFLFCSRGLAFTLAATTIYHEFAQELADFSLLTNDCGLKIWEALVLNFLSGLSVMLGAILIFAANISIQATGAILAVSAGVYLYIAATECIPRIQNFKPPTINGGSNTTTTSSNETSTRGPTRPWTLRTVFRVLRNSRSFHQLVSVFFFMVGAVPIGLVLLNHSHSC